MMDKYNTNFDKNKYIKPEAEAIDMDNNDIITVSGDYCYDEPGKKPHPNNPHHPQDPHDHWDNHDGNKGNGHNKH